MGFRSFKEILLTPRYAKCENCDSTLGERGRGSNKWVLGATGRNPEQVGRNDDDSPNWDGTRCAGTDDGKGDHKPRDGSIW